LAGARSEDSRPLPRMVQRRLDEIYQRHGLGPDTLDQRCLSALGSLPVSAVDSALDQLEAQDLSQIRSIPAWFMSVIKRVSNRGGDQRGGGGSGDFQYGGRGPPGMGGPPDMGPGPPFGMGGPGPDRFVGPPRPPPPRNAPGGGGGDFGPFRGGMPHSSEFDMGPNGMMGGGMMGPGFNGGMPGMPRLGPPGGMGPMGMMGPPGSGSSGSSHAMAQVALGVRVDEFHNLSMHAPMVHAAPALKLQQLWDEGCRLVSLLDDRAWEALAALAAPEALVVIDEVADNMIRNADNIRNINALFMSVANKYLRPGGGDRGGGDRSFQGGDRGVGMGRRDYDSRGGGDRDRDHRPRGGTGVREPGRIRHDGPGDIDGMAPMVQRRIDQLMQTHGQYLNRSHFDEGVVNALKQVGDDCAVRVLDEVASNDLANVRNPPGYMMGIISRYLRGERK